MRTSGPFTLDLDRWWAIAVSIAAGILLGVLVRINASLGMQIGTLEATFAIHGVGTLFATVILLPRIHMKFWRTLVHAPAYEWTGGIFSVAMVFLSNVVVPVLGTALAVSLFVAADLFFSSLTDWFGWLGLARIPLSSRRMLGLILCLLGVVLIHWG